VSGVEVSTGDLWYRNSGGLMTRLPTGTANQHLVGGTTPHWVDTSIATGSGYSKAQVDSIILTLVTDTLKTLTTTNATPTNMDTIYIPNNYEVTVDAVIMFHNSAVKGDRGKMHREITISNVGGTYKVDADLLGFDNQYGTVATVNMDVIQLTAGGPVSFRLTGIASTNIIWTVQRGIKYHQLN